MYNLNNSKPYKDISDNEIVFKKIMSILKEHNSSLSNTKYIFEAIINEIENNNPITL